MPKRRPKGEGGIYQRHDAPTCPPLIDGVRAEHRCRGRWSAQVDLGWKGQAPNRVRVRKTIYGPTKAAVQLELAKAMRELAAGTLVGKSLTVETWMNYWLNEICAVDRDLKINTMKSHRSKAKTHIVPHLGQYRVDKLRPEHIRAMYAAMREQGLSEATLRQTHAILRRALEVAVREGKAARNVATMIDPPKTKEGKRTGLTLEQARAVLGAATGARWHVALYLGMRQGECLALRWIDVNLDEGWLFVEQSLVREPGVGLVFDSPKSEASKRYIPLPTVVLSRLKVAWAEHLARGGTVDDLVFSRDGQPIDHRADWAEWRDLLAALGIPHIPLHAARTTSASLLEAAGVPERMVGQILGQSTIQVTRKYQHAEMQRLREAMQSLESYVETAPGELPSA